MRKAPTEEILSGPFAFNRCRIRRLPFFFSALPTLRSVLCARSDNRLRHIAAFHSAPSARSAVGVSALRVRLCRKTPLLPRRRNAAPCRAERRHSFDAASSFLPSPMRFTSAAAEYTSRFASGEDSMKFFVSR